MRLAYLVIMVGLVGLVAGLSIPGLFWPRCQACRRRNRIDHAHCRHCGAALPRQLREEQK